MKCQANELLTVCVRVFPHEAPCWEPNVIPFTKCYWKHKAENKKWARETREEFDKNTSVSSSDVNRRGHLLRLEWWWGRLMMMMRTVDDDDDENWSKHGLNTEQEKLLQLRCLKTDTSHYLFIYRSIVSQTTVWICGEKINKINVQIYPRPH